MQDGMYNKIIIHLAHGRIMQQGNQQYDEPDNVLQCDNIKESNKKIITIKLLSSTIK